MAYKLVLYYSNLYKLLHYIIIIYLSHWNIETQTQHVCVCVYLALSLYSHKTVSLYKCSFAGNAKLCHRAGGQRSSRRFLSGWAVTWMWPWWDKWGGVNLSASQESRVVAPLWWRWLDFGSASYLSFQGCSQGGGDKAAAAALECGFGKMVCICKLLDLDLDLECELNSSGRSWLNHPISRIEEEEPGLMLHYDWSVQR